MGEIPVLNQETSRGAQIQPIRTRRNHRRTNNVLQPTTGNYVAHSQATRTETNPNRQLVIRNMTPQNVIHEVLGENLRQQNALEVSQVFEGNVISSTDEGQDSVDSIQKIDAEILSSNAVTTSGTKLELFNYGEKFCNVNFV